MIYLLPLWNKNRHWESKTLQTKHDKTICRKLFICLTFQHRPAKFESNTVKTKTRTWNINCLLHFVPCKRIPQQGRSLCSCFFSLFSFDRSDKIITCLMTSLWNPGTYRHKIVRLSSAQFGLVMLIWVFLRSAIRTTCSIDIFCLSCWI